MQRLPNYFSSSSRHIRAFFSLYPIGSHLSFTFTKSQTRFLGSRSSINSESNTHFDVRLRELQKWKEKYPEWSSHPHYFPTTFSIKKYVEKYDTTLEVAAREPEVEVCVAGRVVAKRNASKKLIFYDISEGGQKLQIMTTKYHYKTDFDIHSILRIGDVIGVRGFPAKSKTGQLSIIPSEMVLLSPCYYDIPEKLLDPNRRYRERHVDLLMHQSSIATFQIRSKIISFIRRFLDDLDFLEVETPMLWTNHGGATANPFETSSSAMGKNIPLFLRIAPELFLKQLVIGGFPAIYEIGKVFRNEGMDASHNPEFTMCELYKTHSGLEDLITFTQQLLKDLVVAITGSDKVPVKLRGLSNTKTMIDFSCDFERIEIMPALTEHIGQGALPDPNDNSEKTHQVYFSICQKLGIIDDKVYTTANLIDKLIGHFLEPMCIQPTFLTHHPICLSPLAKEDCSKKGTTARFELIIGGTEICNAYEELNDPAEQQKRFVMANQVNEQGIIIDDHYIEALRYGLPPCAGWGLGIDRLVMLLTGKSHIRDVLFFPLVKPTHSNSQIERIRKKNYSKKNIDESCLMVS